MEAYAVIETGGKQYRVRTGDSLKVEKLEAAIGSTIEIDRVLAVSDGETLKIGAPAVEGCKVAFSVVGQVKGDKVVNFKKKRRKGYHRKVGHRQCLTVLKTERIG